MLDDGSWRLPPELFDALAVGRQVVLPRSTARILRMISSGTLLVQTINDERPPPRPRYVPVGNVVAVLSNAGALLWKEYDD
jgi:hypothetical protein